jgi:hypothetical protein
MIEIKTVFRELFRFKKADYPLIVLLGLIGIYRFSLLGVGAYAWPDEYLYNDALGAVAAFLQLDLNEACRSLTGFGARPAEATLRLIPAAIQFIVKEVWDIGLYDPKSLLIATFPNILSSLLLSVVFYRVSMIFFEGDRAVAVLVTTIYSLLTNSNIYLRHVLPYDTALFFCLLSLYCVLRIKVVTDSRLEPRRLIMAWGITGSVVLIYPVVFYLYRPSGLPMAIIIWASILYSLRLVVANNAAADTREWIIAGLVSGFGLAVYPAYYAFPVAVVTIAVLGSRDTALFSLSRDGARVGSLLGLSILCVMFFYEIVSRIGGESYIGCAIRLSRTITQGSFEEGYVFIPKYFIEVERSIGVALIFLAGVYFITTLFRQVIGFMMSKSQMALFRCILVWIGFYLVYATQSAVFHKMTFTGRYIRMYIPFIVWAAGAMLRQIPPVMLKIVTVRQVAHAAIAAVSLYSFVAFAREYREVSYPINALYDNGIGWEDVIDSNKINETEITPNYNLPVMKMTSGANYITHSNDGRFVLVNFGYFALDGGGLDSYRPPDNAQLIHRRPHFLTFRSSGFEAYTIRRRKEFRTRDYQLTIYKLNNQN